MERIQEPIVDLIVETTQNIAGIPDVQEEVMVQEILNVVVPLPPVEEFTEPVHNPVHQERIVAGEITHNIIGNSAVQEQVIVQELPPIAEQTQETIDVVSSITEMPGVQCATPVGPQTGDVGFDKRGELCEVIRIDGRSWHIRGQIRVLYTWEKRERYESGQRILVSDFTTERDAKRVVEYLAPVIECGSSSSSAAHAARTRSENIIEQLTNMCERIEKRTEEVAMLAKCCAERPLPPCLTSPTDSKQVPSKRRRRTQYAPFPGALQDAVFLAPDAWPPVRHA